MILKAFIIKNLYNKIKIYVDNYLDIFGNSSSIL